MTTEEHTAQTHHGGMVWIEVTNGCNLACGHCYSDSSPGTSCRDSLSHADYLRLIDEAFAAGFSTIQFIGGEPFLYKRLPELIEFAQGIPFEHIEVFSNLTIPRPDVLAAIAPTRTSIATSIYTDDPCIHDKITKKTGSFERTVQGIQAARQMGIELRAGFIEMADNAGHYERTKNILTKLGVHSVGFDRVRGFGRAGNSQILPALDQLCGTCSGNTICITYDGTVLPCIMSRAWPIGSIASSSIAELMRSQLSASTRASIRAAVSRRFETEVRAEGCFPSPCDPCGPNYCQPSCQPGCAPGQSCNPCAPGGSQPCYPNERCNPIGCGNLF